MKINKSNQKSSIVTINVENNNPIINETYKNNKNDNMINDNRSVKEKLSDLLNRNGYIWKINLEIKTVNERYNTKIAGVVNNSIITMEGAVINIDNIIDIIESPEEI